MTRRPLRFFKLSFSFPVHIRRHFVQLGEINNRAGASWKWKRWNWQLREFPFPIITVLSCDLQSGVIAPWGNIVFAYDARLLEAEIRFSAPWSHVAEIFRLDISLFEKRMRYSPLYVHERNGRATTLYSRNVYATSLYVFDTKLARDEVPDRNEKTRIVQRERLFTHSSLSLPSAI